MTTPGKASLLLLSCLFIIIFYTCCLNSHSGAELQTPVEKNGQLSINGAYMVNQEGKPITLRGMSLFWSQWMGKYYNYDCIKWLRDDWHCEVVRAALGVGSDIGYMAFPEVEMKKITEVIEAGIKLGIYIVVDWHSHFAERTTGEAVSFFSRIAEDYGEYPNIIYEVYNEPLNVSWDTVVKPYAEQVIAAIRKYDKNNIVIVGTPRWSQDVDIAAQNPIDDQNVAYAFHFYASTHKQLFRDKCQVAIDSGLALWVSEFGTCFSDGDGAINYEELNTWMDFMKKNKISWCNWSVADKEETSSILKPNADPRGNWPDDMLTESGLLIRNILSEKGD